MIVGIGSILVIIPEYTAGAYSVGEARKDVCVTGGPDKMCAEDSSNSFTAHRELLLLLLSQAFVGIGASPLFTYGITCLDEFDSHKRTGRNLALYMIASTVGPALAFVGCGFMLRVWGDWRTSPADMGIDSSADPRFIGMWWIGFVVCGFVALFTAFPLVMFPKKLKDTGMRKANDVHRTDASLDKDFSDHKYEFFKIILMLLKNKTCMCVILMQTIEAMLMNGYITFIPKLLETLLGFSAGNASLITGGVVVPVGICASYIGGRISKVFENRFKPSMYFVMTFGLLAAGCSSCLLIRCESLNVFEVNVPVKELPKFGATEACSENCHCDAFFNPVCSEESQLTFLSPCHAGCIDSPDIKFGASNWTNCGCSKNAIVKKGYCDASCQKQIYQFIAMFIGLSFCIFVGAPVLQSASLRVVNPKHRDHFTCFGWLWMRILGSIPGAIVFGYIIDVNCMYWQKDCVSQKCQYYNASNLGWAFFYFTIAVKLAGGALLFLAAYFYQETDRPSGKESCRTLDTDASESVKMSYEKNLPTGLSPQTMVY
ncbi:hypothetical protein GCK72_024302 [Caenorhabditis remanei]|uniref:Solute carrier organic anion transporter family member n=2 Tax=Caenorhabditis remanei TaxID=31234 RepID=A0A6A5FYW2_CAERE|nr:hypothetical protein GCK72_024302 [Caenorhabditis remanei]KAF1747836.1 hypothetical protein GCK72_024302 [Caenorhabditis remanei]